MFITMLVLASSPAPLSVDEFENKHDWTEQDQRNTRLLSIAHRENWEMCLAAAQKKLLHRNAAAETIATGVLGSCLEKQNLYNRWLTISYRGLAEPARRTILAHNIIEQRRAEIKEIVVAAVLNSR